MKRKWQLLSPPALWKFMICRNIWVSSLEYAEFYLFNNTQVESGVISLFPSRSCSNTSLQFAGWVATDCNRHAQMLKCFAERGSAAPPDKLWHLRDNLTVEEGKGLQVWLILKAVISTFLFQVRTQQQKRKREGKMHLDKAFCKHTARDNS